MSHVQETQVVHAPLAPTWEAVSKMGAVQDWHPNPSRPRNGWPLDTVMMKRILREAFGMALAGLSYHLETGETVTDSVPDR